MRIRPAFSLILPIVLLAALAACNPRTGVLGGNGGNEGNGGWDPSIPPSCRYHAEPIYPLDGQTGVDPGAALVWELQESIPDLIWPELEVVSPGDGGFSAPRLSASGNPPRPSVGIPQRTLDSNATYRLSQEFYCLLRDEEIEEYGSEEMTIELLSVEFTTGSSSSYPLTDSGSGTCVLSGDLGAVSPTPGAVDVDPDAPVIIEYSPMQPWDYLWIEDDSGNNVGRGNVAVDGNTVRSDMDLQPNTTYRLRAGFLCPDPSGWGGAGLDFSFTTGP